MPKSMQVPSCAGGVTSISVMGAILGALGSRIAGAAVCECVLSVAGVATAGWDAELSGVVVPLAAWKNSWK